MKTTIQINHSVEIDNYEPASEKDFRNERLIKCLESLWDDTAFFVNSMYDHKGSLYVTMSNRFSELTPKNQYYHLSHIKKAWQLRGEDHMEWRIGYKPILPLSQYTEFDP